MEERDNSTAADGEAPIRVLIVEDHAALGEALLFAFGFEVGIDAIGVAPTIATALERVAAEGPDVVLMDVRLPDGSGLDAAGRVKSARPGTAVVIMTAHADQDDAQQRHDPTQHEGFGRLQDGDHGSDHERPREPDSGQDRTASPQDVEKVTRPPERQETPGADSDSQEGRAGDEERRGWLGPNHGPPRPRPAEGSLRRVGWRIKLRPVP